MVVLPKHGATFPVAIFAHGSDGDVMKVGDALRLIAEQGLAAVGFEYDKNNQANFDEQMEGLLRVLSRQPWAQTNTTAWIVQSLGAQRTLSFWARRPQFQPRIMVRLSGGWANELGE
jgi:predicted dienelactone hydrolase